MPGSLIRGGGDNVPGILGACATRILFICQEGHGPKTKRGKFHCMQFLHCIWFQLRNANHMCLKQWWPGERHFVFFIACIFRYFLHITHITKSNTHVCKGTKVPDGQIIERIYSHSPPTPQKLVACDVFSLTYKHMRCAHRHLFSQCAIRWTIL